MLNIITKKVPINEELKENNNALELRVNKFTSKIKELEEKVFNLENINKALNKFKYLYNRLLGYLKNRITKSIDKDKYKELAKDLKRHVNGNIKSHKFGKVN